MIEFTLSMLVLIPLFLGTWAFGYNFFQYSELQDAVRAGARFASLQTYDSATTAPSNSFLTAVQNATVYGDPNADPSSAKPVVSGLTTSNVQLNVGFAVGAPSTMTVAITGFQVQSFPGKVNLNGKPYASFPFLGIWGPP
jgi:Flp pilus assembly protein TadG